VVKEGPPQPAPPPKQPYPAERARGGAIILTTPLRRWVFISGLIGAVALVLGPWPASLNRHDATRETSR
jgi:hypothetical protein